MLQGGFDAIIFDCDGTLVDSEPITTKVFIEYARQFGFEMPFADANAMFAGRDMADIIEYVEAQTGSKLPDDFTEQFRARQAVALRSELKEIPGATELLESLRRPFCLASNAPHKKISINLEVTGLARFFPKDRIFSAYDIGAWKPDPALFLHAAAQVGHLPSRCLVIEDSASGIDGAVNAGMQVVAYQPHGPIASENKPDLVVAHLKELISVLTQ